MLIIFSPLFSQKHLPGSLPGPISGPIPHASGQRHLPQAAVAQLPPHRHVDLQRLRALRNRPPVHPSQRRRVHQTPFIHHLLRHARGRGGRELPTERIIRPFLPQLGRAAQPHALHNLHPLLLIVIFVFWSLPVPQIQKGQAFALLAGQEEGDHGVNKDFWRTELSRAEDLYLMCVYGPCVSTAVFVCYCPQWQLLLPNPTLKPSRVHAGQTSTRKTVFVRRLCGSKAEDTSRTQSQPFV